MDLSGIIFVVLAVAWAVYLVPKALKHHDEVARTRSVERFSTAMRVLARREPVGRRNARLVVTPPRPTERLVAPSRPAASVTARRAAARTAARRRRRVLYVLLLATSALVGLSAVGVLRWWSVAIPVAVIVLFLVLARAQVRRENDAEWETSAITVQADEGRGVVPRRAIRLDAPYGTPQAPRLPVRATTVEESLEREFSADEDTVQLVMSELDVVAVSVETEDGGSLWDPLPVTLPTYVGKARAARTVRTIDLGAPGTWSSGRDDADTALVEQAAAAAESEETASAKDQRAVGS